MRVKGLNINAIDVSEDELLNLGNGILEELLKDHTTGGNIIWATSDYEHLGEGYLFFDEITIDKITGEHSQLIQPRVAKNKDEQRKRSRDMAEVFTPSWVCNAQNNLIDNAWFGREHVFNTEFNEGVLHRWETNPEPISGFPTGKTWESYVYEQRMEMACGEAPYLVSRYDTTTGQFIPVNDRIGLLDRKLRLVNENATEGPSRKKKNWRRWILEAYKSTYGFEWQGDNLLLAREALLMTFVENYYARWNDVPSISELKSIATMIAWNLWQMDGLTYGVPGKKPNEELPTPDNIFAGAILCEPEDIQRYCRIMDWSKDRDKLGGKEITFKTLIKE